MIHDPEPIVEAFHLTKVFKDFWHRSKVKAVDDVSFTIQPGEIFGLLGPNGSGKSTTLKMMLGLLHPTRGTLHVLGRHPRDVKTKARIGFLPEESYLYPYLTSYETLSFFGKLFDLSTAERKTRIEQLLEMIGLKHARNRVVGEFSKGMSRRIGIATTLINDPDLVILDEPTSGLDPLGTRQVKDLILTLAQRGKTVVLSSHLLADVEDLCSRIAILYNGRIQAMGSMDELLSEKGQHRITLPEIPEEDLNRILELTRTITGHEPNVDHPQRSLEQYFVDIVEKAREKSTETSGVDHADGVAEYLQEGSTTPADKLKALTASPTSGPSSPKDEPSEEATPEPDRNAVNQRLQSLVPEKEKEEN